MEKKKIDLYPPRIAKNSIKYFKKCIATSMVSTGGDLISDFEKKIKNYTKSKYTVAFNSGTSALDVAFKACKIQENTEVIAPTLTFVATINAILYNKCFPVFMDCDEYYNIDINKVLRFLKNETFIKNKKTFNKKTKKIISSIVVTHVWGNAVDLQKLLRECKSRYIKLIEDASESLGTFYKKKLIHTGTLGDVGVISFNANKIITSGGGGMLLTQKKEISDRAYYLSTQAKNDSFNFVHNEVGYNYRMINIAAALGLSQFESLRYFLSRKKKIRQIYLKKINKIKNFKLNLVPDYAQNNCWMNLIQVPGDGHFQKKIIKKFIKNNIFVRPVWKLNHTQKAFKNFQSYKIKKAYDLFEKSICLPSSPFLTKNELKKIVSCLHE
jgi:perosamine synthetase